MVTVVGFEHMLRLRMPTSAALRGCLGACPRLPPGWALPIGHCP